VDEGPLGLECCGALLVSWWRVGFEARQHQCGEEHLGSAVCCSFDVSCGRTGSAAAAARSLDW